MSSTTDPFAELEEAETQDLKLQAAAAATEGLPQHEVQPAESKSVKEKPVAPPRPAKRPKAPRIPKPPRQQPPAKKHKPNPSPKGPTRDNPHYKLLCAYGRNPVIGPMLRAHGHVLEPHTLRKVPADLLPMVVDEIEEVLDNAGDSDLANTGITQGMIFLEDLLTTRTKLRLKGTTDKLFADGHWVYLLERMKLRAGIGLSSMPPPVEFAMLTAKTALLVHTSNLSQPSTDLSALAPPGIREVRFEE